MPHLAPRRAADRLDFTGRERREVVVQQERLGGLLRHVDRVDALLVPRRAQRDRHERLRLAAREQRRAVRARQYADLARDAAHRIEVTAVDPLAALQDLLPHRVVLDVLDGVGDVLDVVGELGGELLLNRGLEGRHRLGALALLRQVQRLGDARLGEGRDAVLEAGRRLHFGPFHLGLAQRRGQLVGRLQQLLDALVRYFQRLDDLRLRQLQRPAFDHHDRISRAGHDDIDVGELELLEGRVEDPAAFDAPHAHRRDGPVPGYLRQREGRGRRRHAEHVGVVFLVGRQHVDEDLDFVLEAFREQRPQRAVDHASREDLLVGGPALALQEAARDLAGGVGLFAIFDGQREIRQVGDLPGHRHGGQDDRFAVLYEARARGLFGQAARLEAEGTSRERPFNVLHDGTCLERE